MNKLKLGICLRTSLSASNKSNICFILSRWYSSSKDDEVESTKSDVPKKNVNKKDEKAEVVLNKLNSLLMEMGTAKKSPINLKLSKPLPKQGQKKLEKIQSETEKEAPKEIDAVAKAAKEVAESLGGDTKQTESELMKKLLNPSEEDNSVSISSLSEIFKGMKIDRSQQPVNYQNRSMQVKQILRQNRQQQENVYPTKRFQSKRPSASKPREIKLDNINLFGEQPLGIFTAITSEYSEGSKNKTWDILKEREMKLAVTHPPSNYFQEMILWTEQGKLWKFPIDNEQGLEEEQNVSFADHIFLEKHLEPWCPSRGPIRHFMELVCVGLSKNSYLTVEAKREHIEWYRNYFESKRQLLKEVGAALNEVEQTKEIESK